MWSRAPTRMELEIRESGTMRATVMAPIMAAAGLPDAEGSRADRSQVPRSQHTGWFDIRARRDSCAVLRSHTRRGERAFMPGPTAAAELLPARRWPSRVKRSDTLREILQGCGPAPGNRTEVGGVLASREKRAFRSGYSDF